MYSVLMASRYVERSLLYAHWPSHEYINRAVQEAGAAAEMAATCKVMMYVDLGDRYDFEPITVEIFGRFNAPACHLLDDLGRVSLNSGSRIER